MASRRRSNSQDSIDGGIIFRQFSVDLFAFQDNLFLVGATLPREVAHCVSRFSLKARKSVLLAVAKTGLELGTHMEAVLEITAIEKDTDPLTTSNVKFSRNDWVLAFQYSVLSPPVVVEPEITDEIRQNFILRNESPQQLSVVRVPSYQLDGDILEFEMSARAIQANLVESGLVDYRSRSPTVRNNDSSQLLGRLETVIDYYKTSRNGNRGTFFIKTAN